MLALLTISLFSFTIFFIYIYLKRRYYSLPYDLPGDKPPIFFGSLINSGLFTRKSTPYEIIIDCQRRYGDKFIFWYDAIPCIVFCLPEHAQAILADRHLFDHSLLFTSQFGLLCPNSLVTTTGAKWKRHIRIMLPMFKRAKLISHLDTIVECVDRFIDQELNDGQVHTDLMLKCQSLTINIIGEIAFGYDLNTNTGSSLKTAFNDFVYYGIIVPLGLRMPPWLSKFYLKLNWKYQRAYRFIYELSEKIVEQERNNQYKRENQRPKNLIASMVSSLNEQANDEQISSGLTQSEMFDEILIAMLSSYETIGTAIAWIMFYLSKHPRVQQKIREELREHNLLMTDDTRCSSLLTVEQLASLVYCECVTKEVLRLAPAGAGTNRIATSDTVIDNVPIRRGQLVYIAAENINIDPRYWHHADPTTFVPERFLGVDKDHHPYAMVTFGGGHRVCLGQDLTRLQLKVIIVRLMQRGVILEDTPENTGGYEQGIGMGCYPKKMAIRIHMDTKTMV